MHSKHIAKLRSYRVHRDTFRCDFFFVRHLCHSKKWWAIYVIPKNGETFWSDPQESQKFDLWRYNAKWWRKVTHTGSFGIVKTQGCPFYGFLCFTLMLNMHLKVGSEQHKTIGKVFRRRLDCCQFQPLMHAAKQASAAGQGRCKRQMRLTEESERDTAKPLMTWSGH